MFKNKSIKKQMFYVIALLAVFGVQSVFAQTTAFTYQGKLNDGANPANASYDMQFRLFDLAGAGQGTQQGATITNPTVVVTNGNFAVSLDFGAAVFASGADRFLEISLRPAGNTGGYTSLAPRQKLTSAPYSIRSVNANSADTLSIACVGCVQNSNINSVDGNKVTGTVANATNAVNAINATDAINATNATTATTAITATTATTAENVSGIVAIENGGTGSAEQNFVDLTTDQMIEGNKTFNSIVSVSNITQPVTANGLVKAMIYVSLTGTITRCYNGITNVSTGNCGFSVVGNNGIYDVNFGFAVNSRFITITPYNNQGASISATFETRVQLPNLMIVFLKNSNNVGVPGPFMIVIY